MSRIASVVVAGLAMFCMSGRGDPAYADTYWKFIQITCAPELSYFELRTFGLYNVFDFDDPAQTGPVAEQYGIHRLSELRRGTLTCVLADHDVEVGGEYRAERESGVCGGVEDASLWVKIDGEIVYRSADPYGDCRNPSSLDVRMSKYEVDWCVTALLPNLEIRQPSDSVAVDASCATALRFP